MNNALTRRAKQLGEGALVAFALWVSFLASPWAGESGTANRTDARAESRADARAESRTDARAESRTHATSADQLLGAWGAEKEFGPSGRSTLRIWESEGRFAASVADLEAAADRSGASVTVEFPHDAGSFRGTLSPDGSTIEGHWIQAPGAIERNRFASPVRLSRGTAGSWEGEIRPLQDRFSLYLLFRRDDEGVVRPILRNPERNQGVFLRLASVAVEGDDVQLLNGDGEVVLEGQLRSDGNVLSVFVPALGETFDFTRRARHEAAGLYPRREAEEYTYRTPRPNADRWPTDHASGVGMRAARLGEFVQTIIDTETTSLRTPHIQGLLVARRGKLVLEEYFYGFQVDTPHDLRSASKSFTSLLVGRAIEEGAITPETRVYPLFPESTENPDPRKAEMTVAHLLTMSSGYDCDDNDFDTPGNEDRMQGQSDQPNWHRYTLDLPLVRAPGEAGVYCTGGINLLGGIVARTTDTWLPEFFRTRFASPMGIDHYLWNLDPTGEGYAGGGLRLRPRDFLKFGQMALDGGRWDGHQIVDESWLRESWIPKASLNGPDDYGYAWWRTIHEWEGRSFESWSATGNGGQLLIVVPEFELVVAFNGGNYGDFRTWIRWRDELMPEFIYDAIEN